jgi:hypothetical protein
VRLLCNVYLLTLDASTLSYAFRAFWTNPAPVLRTLVAPDGGHGRTRCGRPYHGRADSGCGADKQRPHVA